MMQYKSGISKIYHILFLVLSFFLVQNVLSQVLVTGQVIDPSGQPLSGANIIWNNNTSMKTVSDKGGYFTLILPEGKQIIQFSYTGYQTEEIERNVYQNMESIEIKMYPSILLKEVQIVRKVPNKNLSDPIMGIHSLTAAEIVKEPVLFGEADILKSIQNIAGVQASSEGNSTYSVRGGTPDENLILLDNCILYNASHLTGFLSVFNNDVVKQAVFYKGYAPAKYGGRLSSILDVSTIDSISLKTEGKAGIGILASRLSLNTPLSQNTQLLIGVRRSYADLFFKLSPDRNLRKSSIYFYDTNLKLDHRFSKNNSISLSLYKGNDHASIDDFTINYGNTTASLIWHYLFNPKLRLSSTISYSHYGYNLSSDLEIDKIKWESTLASITGMVDIIFSMDKKHTFSLGTSFSKYFFHPCKVGSPQIYNYEINVGKGNEAVFYLSNEQKMSRQLIVNYGVRGNIFHNQKVYVTLDPRVSGVIKLIDNISLKASYAHNSQFIQWASRSTSGSPLDVWFPSSKKIKPRTMDVFSVGYYQEIGHNLPEFSAELYYKNVNNTIDFGDNVDLLFNDNIESTVYSGRGRSYGIELEIRQKINQFNFSVNYSLSHSEYMIQGINKGKKYLSPYDRPHFLHLSLNYTPSPRCEFTAMWVFASGKSATFPYGVYETNGVLVPVYSGRNTYRYPDYHRLDISFSYRSSKSQKNHGRRSEWNFSIYNLYARKNPWAISFKNGKSQMSYLFSMLPSVTYNFFF